MGRELPVVSTDERQRPPASEVERLIADASLARSRLSWSPTVPFATGLERTVEWVTRAIGSFRPDVYTV
jgi:dTDP-glucose 4,6-dehydratase